MCNIQFMEKIIPNVSNETATLKTVVVGLPQSKGCAPSLAETYDAKSYESVQKGVYPKDEDIEREMNALVNTLEKERVEVLRPQLIDNYNQIFARDVAFAIDDKLFMSNLIPDRARESEAYTPIWDRIPQSHIEHLPEQAHAEGGDVLPHNEFLFVGTYLQPDYPSFKTARTNRYAVDFLREYFPKKTIVPIELIKHDSDPYRSVLHLDCAFQPVGVGKAIIYPEGFLHSRDADMIAEIFGGWDNLFRITPQEAYYMNSNIFSISPTKLISEERFERLNKHLSEAWGIEVLKVPYHEISKEGGLLRCSTMPLVRE